MATLEEFLRTGKLGPIQLLMTQRETIAHLGEPPDESVSRWPKILKYGGLQITFAKPSAGTEPRLVLIGLYFHSPLEPIPDAVSPIDFTGTSETTVADVREFLARAGLKESGAVHDEDTSLTVASGAQINFRDQRLWSILVAARVSAAHKKQISVSIPEEAWQQLSAQARRSNRSVADLCSQWITQHAGEQA